MIVFSSIRDHLRESFARNGLGDLLDRRYKITGAPHDHHEILQAFVRLKTIDLFL